MGLERSRPGGGGWILVNKFLQVVSKGEERLGEGTVFAAGDCAAGLAAFRARFMGLDPCEKLKMVTLELFMEGAHGFSAFYAGFRVARPSL